MSDPSDRRRRRERAKPAPETELERATSPLAAFLDDAEAALCELREATPPGTLVRSPNERSS